MAGLAMIYEERAAAARAQAECESLPQRRMTHLAAAERWEEMHRLAAAHEQRVKGK